MRTRTTTLVLALAVLGTACADRPDTEVDESAAVTDEAYMAAVTELRSDVRSVLDELSAEIDRLEQSSSEARQEMAEEWSETREEIREHRSELEAELARLETASRDDARSVKEEIAEDIEELTRQVEHARLDAIEGGDEFVAASQEELTEIERNLQTLVMDPQASEDDETLADLRERSAELATRTEALTVASAEEIEEDRTDLTEEIAALSASVQRELFEMRQAVIDGQ